MKLRNIPKGLALLAILVSLYPGLPGCQTTAQKDPGAKERELLESQLAIARNALDTGHPESALQNLRSLVNEFPENAHVQNLMGLTQLSLKNPARATRHFLAAYKIDRKTATGLNLSSAYIESGDPERAIEFLKRLMKQADIEKYQFRERILHNLGYAYVKLKRNANAEKWLKLALDENPTFFPSNLELARLYQRTARPALAMRAYRQSMDYCHVCYEPVQALAQLHLAAGRYGEARRLLLGFSKVEGIAPTDRVEAQKMLRMATTTGIPPSKG